LSAVSANYVVTREPVKSSDTTIYATWVDFGRPNCWAYQRSCRGDADGIGGGIGTNKVWVNSTDLNILAAGYNKKVAELKLASYNGVPSICADNNRIGGGIGANKVWVNSDDLNNLALYFNKKVADCPVCDQTNYWFWTN